MDVQVRAQPTGQDVGSEGMGSTGAGSPGGSFSTTRQCVCGGWTRFIVCQYCGTTDPHVAAAGMISMTPLVQRSPEEAAAHIASNVAEYDGAASWEAGSHGGSFSEAGTHAAPPLPPTTFAEAQFGEAPSAAAAFASNAHAPSAALVKAPFETPSVDEAPERLASAFTSSAFARPVTASSPDPIGYPEPAPGWNDAPMPAPPGWATVAPAPGFPYEPGGAAPAPVAPAFEADVPVFQAPAAPARYPERPFADPEVSTAALDLPAAAFDMPALDEPALDEPALDEPADQTSALEGSAAASSRPAAVAYPVPPASYELLSEFEAAETSELAATQEEEQLAGVKRAAKPAGAKRALPRWALPAAAAAVVVIGGGVYLATSGSGSTDNTPAPVVRHTTQPATGSSAGPTTAPGVTTPGVTVAPAIRLAQTAPTGYTAVAPGVQVAKASLAAGDSLHSAAELRAAGVTSATATTFLGPGGAKVTTLTETAASPAQAATLATQFHTLGYTMQAANGRTVYALHDTAKPASVVAAFNAWTSALKG